MSEFRFIPPCNPVTAKSVPAGDGWVHEVKSDGYRVQAHKVGSRVLIYSRNGHDFTDRFRSIAQLLHELPVKAAVLDDEVVANDADGGPNERRIAEDHKNLLIAELDHRVKNVLACVAAVAQQSRERSRSADHFLNVFNGRIQSLANAHALLSRSRWEGVGVGELVRSELARCTSDGNHLIEGPDIVLDAQATQPLVMVLHELTTNATKYGALSSPNGRVSVRWGWQSSHNSQDCLALEWRETGGPPVIDRGHSGYGSSVIRDLIPFELGGSVDYLLAPEGVRCRVEIPPRWLRNVLRGCA